jgi:DNA-binding NarL/FixJ family response regulator
MYDGLCHQVGLRKCLPGVRVAVEIITEEVPMRILVAEHRPRIRFALHALLGQTPGLEIVSEAMDAGELLAQAKLVCPDLVLLDWSLRDLSPPDLLPALRHSCPGLSIIALSGREEELPLALEAGVDAFVCKCDPPGQLLETIREFYRE